MARRLIAKNAYVINRWAGAIPRCPWSGNGPMTTLPGITIPGQNMSARLLFQEGAKAGFFVLVQRSLNDLALALELFETI